MVRGMIYYTPWRLYEWYGDRAILEEAYEPMKRYVEHLGKLAAESEDGLLHWSGASDWIEVGIEGWGRPKRTPAFLVSTLAWHLYATQLAATAAVLGIRNDPAHPGFARFVIHPEQVAEVDWARGHYDTPRGRVSVDWKKAGGAFTLQLEVPANTRATVYLPAREGEKITEVSREIAQVPGIVDLGHRGPVAREPGANEVKRKHQRKYLIERFISSKYQEPVTIEDLSRELHLSSSRATHLIKELYGRTFVQQVTQFRLRHAAGMLWQTDKSVTDVAMECGFGDLSNFHKAFSKHFHMTPLQYRKRGSRH